MKYLVAQKMLDGFVSNFKGRKKKFQSFFLFKNEEHYNISCL